MTHVYRVHAQTWSDVPPFRPVKMYQAQCQCGWQGTWWHYANNAHQEAQTHARSAVTA